MSFNSSSSPQFILISLSLHSSNSSIPSFYEKCLDSVGSIAIFTVYTFTSVLFLLPLYVLVLCMGFQRWRNQQSASHSDFFTYHCVIMEILVVLGSFIYCLGMYTNSMMMVMLGMLVSFIILPGQTLFHLLTCMERYLAVVHPVTYMRLRDSGVTRIRNISIVCVWLLCFGWVGLTKLYMPDVPVVPLFCMLCVSIASILFSCLSVLFVLSDSGPGEGRRNTELINRSKQRAFHIICTIMVVLLLRSVGLLVMFGLSYLQTIRLEDLCVLMDFGIFLTIPSSVVLPLLFLHKSGKLTCCGHSTQSG